MIIDKRNNDFKEKIEQGFKMSENEHFKKTKSRIFGLLFFRNMKYCWDVLTKFILYCISSKIVNIPQIWSKKTKQDIFWNWYEIIVIKNTVYLLLLDATLLLISVLIKWSFSIFFNPNNMNFFWGSIFVATGVLKIWIHYLRIFQIYFQVDVGNKPY